jgi:hypothetical protein
MTDKKKMETEEEDFRKLLELVANEPDPQRLSDLIDQLIKKLDSRRARAFATTRGQIQSQIQSEENCRTTATTVLRGDPFEPIYCWLCVSEAGYGRS